MSKNLFPKYYQENNERIQRRKRKKSDNVVVNVTKVFQKMKSKSLLSIEKIL